MTKTESSISKGKSLKEIGDFWDEHGIDEFWDQTKEVNFTVDIKSQVTYYAIDKNLAKMLHRIAQKRGISSESLINLWIQEKVKEQDETP